MRECVGPGTGRAQGFGKNLGSAVRNRFWRCRYTVRKGWTGALRVTALPAGGGGVPIRVPCDDVPAGSDARPPAAGGGDAENCHRRSEAWMNLGRLAHFTSPQLMTFIY
jgi:hypothetical protein